MTAIYLVKEFAPEFSYLEFFVIFGWVMAVADAALSVCMALYFLIVVRRKVLSGLPLDITTSLAKGSSASRAAAMSDEELLSESAQPRLYNATHNKE